MGATKILSYEDLYKLSEELQQLRGAQLQGVSRQADLRYALDFRLPGQNRWLVLDLTPAKPFMVSMKSTRHMGPKNPTPVLNFLKAHFVNLHVQSLEVAQKPNRTVRMIFSGGKKKSQLVFQCFPHGQHLVLSSDGKFVNLPLRAKPQEDEEVVTFIEPEASVSWDFNDETASTLTTVTEVAPSPSDTVPYHQKLIKKLEKAVAALDKDAETRKDQRLSQIAELQKEAETLKLQGNVDGEKLQGLYVEIKKIKRKSLLTTTRRNELDAQLQKLKAEPPVSAPRIQMTVPKKGEQLFSGTRVELGDVWELWVGRDHWQNDDLVRLAGPHELWIHLRDYPGAHGVIRGPKKGEPKPQQIEFACRVVALLSQSKKNPFREGEKLDFIVTPRKYVKKPKGAPPGRVIVERESVRRIAFKIVKFNVM